jgi:hypothetical protein
VPLIGPPRSSKARRDTSSQFGFEVYLPRIRRYQIRYRHRVELLTPLFPGYCFTRIELQWHDVRQSPGVDPYRRRRRRGTRVRQRSATGCRLFPAFFAGRLFGVRLVLARLNLAESGKPRPEFLPLKWSGAVE